MEKLNDNKIFLPTLGLERENTVKVITANIYSTSIRVPGTLGDVSIIIPFTSKETGTERLSNQPKIPIQHQDSTTGFYNHCHLPPSNPRGWCLVVQRKRKAPPRRE